MNQALARPVSERAPSSSAARRISRFSLLFRLLATLTLALLAHPVSAAPPSGPQKADVWVIIMAFRGLPDQIGVTYGTDPGQAQVERDLKDIARLLGSTTGPINVTRNAGLTSGETNISGLTNWSTGVVELDPIIQTLRRFGHFHIMCMLAGQFPLQSADRFSRGPMRVEPRVERTPDGASMTVDYEVWVDQSHGVPGQMPSVKDRGWDARWVGVMVALLGVALLGVVLIIKGLRPQRRVED